MGGVFMIIFLLGRLILFSLPIWASFSHIVWLSVCCLAAAAATFER